MSQTAIAIKGGNRDSLGKPPAVGTVNMVTNIKDSVICSQSLENYSLQDSKVGIMSFPCDFDHMYASLGEGVSTPKEKNEYKHLKEICLQYLDLIQQQSDCITQQDKQIQSLRQENEALKQHLLRKDRRAARLKRNSDLDFGDGDTISTRSHSRNTLRGSVSPRGTDVHKRPRSRNIGDLDSEGTCQSPVNWEDTPCRRDYSEDGGASISSGYDMRDDSSSTTASQLSRVRKPPFHSRGRNQRGKRSLSLCSKENSSSSSRRSLLPTTPCNKEPPVKRSRKIKSEIDSELSSGSALNASSALMTTNQPYYTATAGSDPVWNMQDLCPESEPDFHGEMLETPQWRTKVYSSLYSMEGTENLDDEVFLKRHQRLELDERRRKRWDVQRIREQRHIEKLRQRELATSHTLGTTGTTGSHKEDPIGSLWPNPEDAQYLEVSDELPVGAFGLPVAKFSPSEFELPWDQPSSMEDLAPTPKQVKRRRSAPATSRRRRIGRGGASRSSLSLHGRKRNYSERK